MRGETGKGLFRYQMVEERVREMIETGALRPGDKAPSLRGLSSGMNVSISTVTQAYAELENKGVLTVRPRSGYYVRANTSALPPPMPKSTPDLSPKAATRSGLIRTVLETVGNTRLLPFGVASPAEEFLPVKALARAMAAAQRKGADRAVTYETIAGSLELRRQLAYLALDGGMTLDPRELIITNGCLEALYISLRALTRPGDKVLIQSPTYYCFLQLLETLGLRAIEIPSCPKNGVGVEDVRKGLETFDIRVCILCPTLNNPDGGLTPDSVKEEIVDLLANREIPLIEDDVYGDLRFQGKRPATCKTYDQKGLVLLCSSFSKTVAPGYRVGWMAPGRFHGKAMDIKATTNVCTSTPVQQAMVEYLRGGGHERHLRRLRAGMEKQMRTMQLAVSRYFPPETRVTRPEGGLVLWLELDPAVDSVEFFFAARAKGIGIVPGQVFSTQDKYKNFIRLSCGGVWGPELEAGLKALGRMAGR